MSVVSTEDPYTDTSPFLRLPTELQEMIFDTLFNGTEPYTIPSKTAHLRSYFDAGEVALPDLFLLHGQDRHRVFRPRHPHLAVSRRWRNVAMGPFFRGRVFSFKAREDDVERLKDVPGEWRERVREVCLRVDLAVRGGHVEVGNCIKSILTLLPNLRYLRLDIRGVADEWGLRACDENHTAEFSPFRYPFVEIPWIHTIAQHPQLRYFSTKHESRYSDWSDWVTRAENWLFHPELYGVHLLEWYIRICIAAKRYSSEPARPIKGICHWQDQAMGWERFREDCRHFEKLDLPNRCNLVEFLGELFEGEGCREGASWCRAKRAELM